MDYKHANLNKNKSEGSIAQWYIIQETMSFCESYLQEEKDGDEGGSTSTSGPKYKLSVYSEDVVVIKGNLSRMWKLSREEEIEAHWAVLLNTDEARPYLEYHRDDYCRGDLEEHKKGFSDYFLEWMMNHFQNFRGNYNPELHELAGGPQRCKAFPGAFVNGVKFVATERDQGKVTQNNGVMALSKDDDVTFYGILLSVYLLTYGSGMEVVLFKCRWFDSNPCPRSSARPTMVTDRHGFVSIDTNSSWYEHEPYILATSAKQVFYIDDPCKDNGWKIVQVMTHRNIWSSSTLGEDTDAPETSSSVAVRNSQPRDPYQEDTPRIVRNDTSIRDANEIHEHRIVELVQILEEPEPEPNDDDYDSQRTSQESEEADDSEDEDYEI